MILFFFGEFSVIFLEDVEYIEIEAFRIILAIFWLYGDIVEMGRAILLPLYDIILEIKQVVLMLRVDYHPGIILVKPGSCRHYRLKNMIKLVLQDVGKIVFLFSR